MKNLIILSISVIQLYTVAATCMTLQQPSSQNLYKCSRRRFADIKKDAPQMSSHTHFEQAQSGDE